MFLAELIFVVCVFDDAKMRRRLTLAKDLEGFNPSFASG
jgi:hypothetical protein